jgi:hypothetical protein
LLELVRFLYVVDLDITVCWIEEEQRVIGWGRDLIKKGELVMAKVIWGWRRWLDDLVGDYFNFNLHFSW